jgi:hypothetical protein
MEHYFAKRFVQTTRAHTYQGLANIAPIFRRCIHLSNFVNNGSKICETDDRSARLPIQPRDILSRAPQQKCALNVFNRNMIKKEGPGKIFICRSKSEANAPAGFQEHLDSRYVIVGALGVFRRSGYHIRLSGTDEITTIGNAAPGKD